MKNDINSLSWKILWNMLSFSEVYRLFGKIIGAKAFRDYYATTFVRANPGDRLLDIGCGPGDILRSLPALNYVGFDINPAYIEAAKCDFGDRGQFLAKSITKETVGEFEGFDLVLANGLIHHLDDDQTTNLLDIAYSALKPGGRLVTMDGVYTTNQSPLARYLVSRDRGRYVRSEDVYVHLAKKVFPRVEPVILHNQLRIPYTHIVMECFK